jgi:hypothetical protein
LDKFKSRLRWASNPRWMTGAGRMDDDKRMFALTAVVVDAIATQTKTKAVHGFIKTQTIKSWEKRVHSNPMRGALVQREAAPLRAEAARILYFQSSSICTKHARLELSAAQWNVSLIISTNSSSDIMPFPSASYL